VAAVAQEKAPPADLAAAEAAIERGREATTRWDFAAAVRELEPALATYDRLLPKNDPRIEPVVISLARAYRGASRWDLGERAARRAAALAADASDASEQLIAQNELGLIYEESGRKDEAIAVYQAALDSANARGGDDIEEAKVTTEHNLGLAYSDRGDYAEAERLLEHVLAADRKADPRSVSTANTMHNLALAYRDDGKLDQAKAMFEEALAILTERLGTKHARLGPTLNGLAGTLHLKKDLAGAEALYRRSLALSEAGGQLDPVAASDLADVETDLGHPAEALVLIEKSLAAELARSPYPNDEIVRTLVKRLRAHLALGNLPAAEADTTAAISASRQANANNPTQVKVTIKWVADEWQHAGNAQRARSLRLTKP